VVFSACCTIKILVGETQERQRRARGRPRSDERQRTAGSTLGHPNPPGCTCEHEIVCTFEGVICNILQIPDIFGRL
jgi:hypothetical protein